MATMQQEAIPVENDNSKESPNADGLAAPAMHPSQQQAMVVIGHITGAMTTNMMCLGEALGLYKGLNEVGPCSAERLAQHLKLNHRYVEEWCRQQAAAKVITTDEKAEKYWLNEPQKDVLVRENGADASPFFSGGFLAALPALQRVTQNKLPELFQQGGGLDYDAYGEPVACGVCRELGVWLRHFLVDRLHNLPGDFPQNLESGCHVADVGCGCGIAVLTAAAAFPNSTFHGYDISEIALTEARDLVKKQNLKNVEFINPGLDESGMHDATYDIVMTHDAIHDMATPFDVMKSVKKSIKPGGIWIIGDMSAANSHADNIHKHPLSPLMYGFSCHICLPSAMSAPNSVGLGTMGLSEELAREKLMEAGFKKVDVLDWGHPLNRYYLASTE
jgi:ubiquinone/menaquinone biosynthesis C-methylase UbiE